MWLANTSVVKKKSPLRVLQSSPLLGSTAGLFGRSLRALARPVREELRGSGGSTVGHSAEELQYRPRISFFGGDMISDPCKEGETEIKGDVVHKG